MSTGNRRFIVVATVIAALVLAGLLAFRGVGSTIERKAVRQLEDRLGVEARIGGSDLDPTTGTIVLRDLTVEGCCGGLIVEIATAGVRVAPGAVTEMGDGAVEEAWIEGVHAVVDLTDPGARKSLIALRRKLGSRLPDKHEAEETDADDDTDETDTDQTANEDGAATDSADEPRPLPRWLRLLAPDARFRLADAEATVRDGSGERRLQGVRGTAQHRGDGRFLLIGQGHPGSGGDLRWWLDTTPLERRAVGTLRVDRLPLALIALALPEVPLHRPEDGLVDARLALSAGGRAEIDELPEPPDLDREVDPPAAASGIADDGDGPLRFHGRMRLAGLGLDSPRLAEDPITGIDLEIEARGVFFPEVDAAPNGSAEADGANEVGEEGHDAQGDLKRDERPDGARRLVIDEGTVRLGDASVDFDGMFLRGPETYRAVLDLRLPSTDCNAAIGAIPDAVLGPVRDFSWSGSMAGHLKVEVDSTDLDATELAVDITDRCRFRQVPQIADLDRFASPFVHRVEETDGDLVVLETGPGSESWVPLAQVSPFMVHAVLAHEDAGFLRHEGFATYAIENALAENLEAGEFVRGASTISMQLAKNLFLSRDKTLSRKVREAILTWWLEEALSKAEILELYLNVIEYGPELYGLEPAARHHFGLEPADLTLAQSVYLASVLPSPVRYHQQYEDDELWNGFSEQMRYLVRHMLRRERIDQAAHDRALAEIDSFRFHRGGDGEPARRRGDLLAHHPGRAADLPFATAPGPESRPRGLLEQIRRNLRRDRGGDSVRRVSGRDAADRDRRGGLARRPAP